MLGGDAWVDGIGTVVCHNEWCVHGAVLADSELLLHMVRVQAIGFGDQGQDACRRRSMFHAGGGRDDQGVMMRRFAPVRSVCRE